MNDWIYEHHHGKQDLTVCETNFGKEIKHYPPVGESF